MRPKRQIALLALFAALPYVAAAQLHPVSVPFDAGSYQPLSQIERWQRWRSETGASSSMHVNAFLLASLTQSLNDPPQWGRTAGGYARRVGGEYGGLLISSSVHEGLAAVEGTDPRYFPCACTGLFRRSAHALEMTVLTYSRNGHKTLDLPQLSGEYASNMIGTLWMPSHYSPWVQGVQAAHVKMGLIGSIHIVQEFSPELKRFFHVNGNSEFSDPYRFP